MPAGRRFALVRRTLRRHCEDEEEASEAGELRGEEAEADVEAEARARCDVGQGLRHPRGKVSNREDVESGAVSPGDGRDEDHACEKREVLYAVGVSAEEPPDEPTIVGNTEVSNTPTAREIAQACNREGNDERDGPSNEGKETD
jgi:hypothetical protein